MQTKTKHLLAVAILLGVIAFSDYSHAQTSTPTPAPTQQQLVSGSANALIAARDWAGLMSLAQPYVTGNFVQGPLLTEVQHLNNMGIGYVTHATLKTTGAQAAHDYALEKGAWLEASYITQRNLRNPRAAITELQHAIEADPANAGLLAYQLVLRAATGENVNADITALIKAQPGLIKASVGMNCYRAYNATQATRDDAVDFYDLLLRSVESNQQSAAFIGRLIDQKNKLTK